MDKAEVIEKLKGYSNLIKKYFPVKMVILFGSYSNNCAREDSDIDVAVDTDTGVGIQGNSSILINLVV